MMAALVRIPFAENLLSKVQGFDCGSEPWELEVSNWIKSPAGAVADLAHGNQVWLYATDQGDLVGFGSLGEAWQRWPTAKDPRLQVSIIPMIGLDKRYWGQPPGPREQRYSARILDDLIVEATKRCDNNNGILILFVNEKNTRAISLYERAGFVPLQKPFVDKATGFVNQRYVLVLQSSP